MAGITAAAAGAAPAADTSAALGSSDGSGQRYDGEYAPAAEPGVFYFEAIRDVPDVERRRIPIAAGHPPRSHIGP